MDPDNMDVVSLAQAGASAIVSAMATEVWPWVREEMSDLFGYGNQWKAVAESKRLEALAGELATRAERDVHNWLRGFLEARLTDNAGNSALMDRFHELTEQIYGKLGIEPPTSNASGSGGVVAQSGRDTPASLVASHSPVNWAALTGAEAARRLEAMRPTRAVKALTEMDPAAAVRRLSFVAPDRAAQLLSHLDVEQAANLLAKMPSRQADLLARMEPSRGAAVLDMMNAEWAVARLTEMDLDRALVLLGTMGSKRTANLLNLMNAMQGEEAAALRAAVRKIRADQAAMRRTFDLARQKAEQHLADARREAQETAERAKTDAERRAPVEAEAAEPRETTRGWVDGDESPVLLKRVADHLNACYPAELTVRQLRKAVGASSESIDSALRKLVGAGLVEMTRGGRAPRYLGSPVR
jgi:MgtE intracellular N domain